MNDSSAMDVPDERTQEEKLSDLFDKVARSDAPGCVVGVRHRGRQILRKAYGLASVALGVANNPTTRMRIGSTSKHFTGLPHFCWLKKASSTSTHRYAATFRSCQCFEANRRSVNS